MHAVYRSQLSRGHQGVLPAAVGARPSAPVRGDGVGTGAGLAGGESAGPGTVGAVLTDPLVQSPGAGAGTMLLVVLGREWILLRLDAWFYPEIIDQREALAHAATVLAKVT